MEKIALDEFLNYQFLSGVEFAPGSDVAAFVVKGADVDENSYKSSIWIRENGKVRKLTGLDKESTFIWEDPEHILFPAVRSAEERKRVEAKEIFTAYYRINIHGGEAEKAFEIPLNVAGIKKVGEHSYAVLSSIDAKYPDRHKMSKEEQAKVLEFYKEEEDYQVIDELPFWMNGDTFIANRRTAVFYVDIKEKTCERISEPWFEVSDMQVEEGTICYCGEAYRSKPKFRNELYAYDTLSGERTCLYNKNEKEIYNIFFMDGELYVIATEHKRYGINENPYIYRLDVERKDLEVFYENQESIGNSVGSDCRLGGGKVIKVYQNKLYYISTRRNSAHLFTLDSDANEEMVITKEGSVDCFDISEKTGEILLVGMYDNRLQELYSMKEDELTQRCSDFNTQIMAGKYVAGYDKITIRSRGTDIDGFIMKPYGYCEDATYPAILDIHGGPKTVYGPVFYHEMQYWAGQGYFVFFCNPTGGDGRGNEFADIRGKYGTIDYENIMDFTDEVLKKYPQIDKSRVAVTGGSYGGFMTNWIIGHTDRFVAAATQRSISNWVSFYGISDIGNIFGTDQTAGDIFENVEQMWNCSPLKYAKNITTPTLFIHSNEDYRCPMAEGMQLYTALMDKGVPTRMCYFKGENHDLSRSGRPKHRVRRLTEITDWIRKYTE